VITADLVVTNATIHTMSPEQPSATWFAVLGGDVVAVGSGHDDAGDEGGGGLGGAAGAGVVGQ
jgi:predicted amidohydrolase YtcJ